MQQVYWPSTNEKQQQQQSLEEFCWESHTGRTFPYIATRECPSVGRVLIGGSQCELSYHAGAELLQEAWPLRARQAGGRPTRANAAHAGAEQEGHTAARIRHTATLTKQMWNHQRHSSTLEQVSHLHNTKRDHREDQLL